MCSRLNPGMFLFPDMHVFQQITPYALDTHPILHS